MARKRRYINNIDFANAIIAWKKDDEPLPLPDYIAECFLQIVKRYGSKRNFSGYTYLQDMKSEALEHMIKYCNRFNEEKSVNAFAYFTQICHNAFIQYIKKEKKIADFRFEMTRDSMENAHKLDWNNISRLTDWEVERAKERLENVKL